MLITPKYALTKVVEVIKSNTSKTLKQKFNFLHKVYWDNKVIWTKGYNVLTFVINEKIIQAYLQMQEEEIKDKWSLNFKSIKAVRA